LQQYPEFAPGASVYQELFQTVSANSDAFESVETTVKKSLYQMGIPESLWDQQATSLSGGEKTKLMLCKVLTYLQKRRSEFTQSTSELDLVTIHSYILQLECDLAFIGGKLNDRLGEDEQKSLNEEFIKKAQELNKCRQLL